jgi:hypothetical protein
MNFVEELKWRGMIHDIMPGAEEQFQKEMTTGLCGHRPHSRLAAYWSPGKCDDAQTLAACRPQTHRAGGWCNRYDWRPLAKIGRAQPAR